MRFFNFLLWLAVAAAVILWRARLANDQIAVHRVPHPPLLMLQGSTTWNYDDHGAIKSTLEAQKLIYRDNGSELWRAHFNDQEKALELWAKHAQVGPRQEILDLYGQVVAKKALTSGLAWVFSEELHYNQPQGIAHTPLFVRLKNPQSETTATGAIWHLKENFFILQKNIWSRYVPPIRP